MVASSEHQQKPILLGKLKKYSSGRLSLICGEGTSYPLKAWQFDCLRAMDGFRSIDEIAEDLRIPAKSVEEVVDRFMGAKSVTWLSRWNKLRWCSTCRSYCNSLGDRCPCCQDNLNYVPVSPPCDPWICLPEERHFISGLIANQTGLQVPENTVIMANNGFSGGHFFWEVIIEGQVVMVIRFEGTSPEDWRVECSPSFSELGLNQSAAASLDVKVQEILRANTPHVEELVDDSLVFIEEMACRWPSLPLVYFSGGKESMAMYQLFRDLDREANFVFAGTGLDFPEDIEFMLSLQRNEALWIGQHLHVVTGQEDSAAKGFLQYGPITLANTWCREILKYPNRDAIVARLYPDYNFVAFEGSRWYENDFRRSHPRVMFADIAGYSRPHMWAFPLAPWTSLDIWTYILANKLPVNPLYYSGFQRTTCWVCPLVNPYHVFRSHQLHPELWAKAMVGDGDAFQADPHLNPW